MTRLKNTSKRGAGGSYCIASTSEVVPVADAAARRCHPTADVRRSIHEYRPLVARGKAQSCPELKPRRPCLIPLHFAAEIGIGQETHVPLATSVTQVLRATCTRSSPSDSRPNTFLPTIPIRRSGVLTVLMTGVARSRCPSESKDRPSRERQPFGFNKIDACSCS